MGARLIRRLIPELRRLTGLERLGPSECVGIAVSGGADSLGMARLLALKGRAFAEPRQWVWIHVRHGWRQDSDSEKDLESLRVLASELGVALVVESAPSPRDRATPEGWEAHARSARYQILKNWCESEPGAVGVLTAHTLDDQAETMLWRLCTGSFEARSQGILRAWGRVLRPGLGIQKAEWEQYLNEEGVRWVEDPSNQDERFLRVRIRKRVLPGLLEVFPRAKEHLALLADSGPDSNEEGVASLPPELGRLLRSAGLSLRKGNYTEILKRLNGPRKTWTLKLTHGVVLSQAIKKNGKPLTLCPSAPIVEEVIAPLDKGRSLVWSLKRDSNT